jgi:hypothetical protein
MTVYWYGPQNQVGYSLSVVPQNRREDEDDTGHALRSSGLLCLKVSQTRVSLSNLKTGEDMAQMVHVASSRRSRGDESNDTRVDAIGYIELFYPNFVIFIVLSHKSSLVISFPIIRIPRASGEASIQSSLSHHLATIVF